jgi:glutamate-1-semialdehyde 2,1-aminomutase
MPDLLLSTHATLRYKGPVLGASLQRGLVTWPPVIARSAKGCEITDAEGNSYLDFTLAFGAVILGHAHPKIDDAVIEAIRSGVAPTINSHHELELTDLLCSLQPEEGSSAVILRTGSDATDAAVRLCRAATGRDVVIRCGYNGWHDWCAPRRTGIPAGAQLTLEIPFNDEEAAREAAARAGDRLACIVVVAADPDLASHEFLAGLRHLADAASAALVLDEVRTGFRLAIGGAQEYFNVKADLVCYSKALANGYCVSAVVGRQEILSEVENISLSSLYFRSVDGVAAAISTVKTLRDTAAIEHIWRVGSELQCGLREVVAETGSPVRVTGCPVMPFHEFLTDDEALGSLARRTFSAAAAEHGALFHPDHHWFVCAAMSSEDIARGLAAARAGYEEAARLFEGLKS